VTLADEIDAAGTTAGLDAVGFAPADPFTGTRVHLERRKGAGLHGGMQFTYRNPERSTTPALTLAGARSIVVGALAYRTAPPPESGAPRPALVARVAAYAQHDHYARLRAALSAVAGVLEAHGHRARIVVDDNALVDREAAYRAGLGWYGKNTNLLLPGKGSWFVLGSVLTDAVLAPATPVADGCGSCDRCRPACPTGALAEPGVLDARRCLAWLLQAEGPFPERHREALGDRIYGCDDCQDVCPPNRRVARTPSMSTGDTMVELEDLLSLPDQELLARFGRWYIPRRDPRYLRRNALVVLGNVGDGHDPRTVALLQRWLAVDDALLREHAEWAARRLGRSDLAAADRQ
jgi:epoxyqueuosine reductase